MPLGSKVELKATPKAAKTTEPSTNHLAAIRSGFKLRKVAAPDEKNALPDISHLDDASKGDLMSTLQAAMRSRLVAIKGGPPTPGGAAGKNDHKAHEADDWSDDES